MHDVSGLLIRSFTLEAGSGAAGSGAAAAAAAKATGAPSPKWVRPSVDEMAAHMRRLYEEPRLRRRLGAAARAVVLERYDTYLVGVGW